MKPTPAQKIKAYADRKGLSIRQVEIKSGLGNGTLNKSLTGGKSIGSEQLEKLFATFEDLRPDYVFGHEDNIPQTRTKIDIVEEPPAQYGKRSIVPFFGEVWASAGSAEMFTDREKVTEYLHIPGLSGCDAAITILGDSMIPRFNPGDIVLIKEVLGGVLWGEPHLVILADHRLLKYVQQGQSPKSISLVSENEFYGPIEVEKSDILKLYQVRARVQRFSM